MAKKKKKREATPENAGASAPEAATEAIEDRVDEAYRTLQQQWRDNPVAAAGLALGVGVLLGLLLGSRR